MPETNQKWLRYGLLAAMWIMAYALTQGSVFPQGDDLAHLATDRRFPIPITGIWISNRVVDGFFTPFCFQVFEILYDMIPGLSGSRDFVDLYQAYNAFLYSTLLTGAVFVTYRSIRACVGNTRFSFIFSTVLAFCLLVTWMPPNGGSTVLFALQITGVITVAFLLIAYPLLQDEIDSSGHRSREPVSGPRYLLLSVLAYLTAVGLEIFVVFAWLYIATYYAALFTTQFIQLRPKRTVGPVVRSMFSHGLKGHTITLQFFCYSAWSLYTLTTSWRTKLGLHPGAETVAAYHSPELNMASFRSSGAALCALVLVVCITLLYFRRGDTRKKRFLGTTDHAFTPSVLMFLSIFSLIFTVGYVVAILTLSHVAFLDYLSQPRYMFPLKFILMVQLMALSVWLLTLLRNTLIEPLAVIALVIYSISVVEAQMVLAGAERTNADRIRKAFRAAAVAKDNYVRVPFALPQDIPGNEGWPMLPGPNSAEWYRSSYRLMLNKYYKTNFDYFGPIFYTGNDPAGSGPPKWPSGAVVTVSSTANSAPSFDAKHAIDGDVSTFWADNTPGAYPDVLVITSPQSITLPGITVVSHEHGRVLDFSVDTWDGKAWVLQKTVSDASTLITNVAFGAPVHTTQVRITITRDEPSRLGEYTRISEVIPYVVSDLPPDAIASPR